MQITATKDQKFVAWKQLIEIKTWSSYDILFKNIQNAKNFTLQYQQIYESGLHRPIIFVE